MKQIPFANKRVHILGIAGTLMGAFAAYLKRSGVVVTGSDQNIYPPMSGVLERAGIEVFSPFSASNIERANPDVVIVGNVIRADNVEMVEVQRRQIKYFSLPSALETEVLPHKHSIVVSGTHGKTTTSSMMSWVLECLGHEPSFFVGGVLKNFTDSFRITDSKYMVLEGDEYDTAFFDKIAKFTHYLPKDVILTSIEYDHADIYPDMPTLVRAFDKLVALLPNDGNLVVCGEYETTLRVALASKAPVTTYGFGDVVDSRATKVVLNKEGAEFKWSFKNEAPIDVKLAAPGRHNVLNALGVLTLVRQRGLDITKAVDALSRFGGVQRRQEVVAEINGVTLIDDFAHHPTAVRETLAAMRGRYSNRRIIACFEPRSATSRRKIFQQAYAESFDIADYIYIAKPYEPNAQPPAFEVFSTQDVVEDLKKRSKRAAIFDVSDEGVKHFVQSLKSGDVVVVMSNGGFSGVLRRIEELLRAKKN